MTDSNQTYAQYPCPTCVATMLPGTTRTFPSKDSTEPGTGLVWSVYTGAATAYPPPSTLVTCHRCKGSGLVGNRRVRPDRRVISYGRREGDAEEARAFPPL